MEIIDFVIKTLEKEALRARKLSNQVDEVLKEGSLLFERIECHKQFNAVTASDKTSSEKVAEYDKITKKLKQLDEAIEKRERILTYENITKASDAAVWAMSLEDEITRLKYWKSRGRTGLL